MLQHPLREGSGNQIGWIFGIVPKGGGVIFNPKIYIEDFGDFKQVFLSIKLISGNHEHAFHTIWPFCLLAYMQPYPLQKICNIIFQKWGGGPKAVWNVSKKSFDLVARPFPYTDFDAFTVADTQTYKIRFSALSFWTKLKGRRQKKWYFLGIFPKPVDPPPPLPLGTFRNPNVTFGPKKVGCSRPKTMVTEISHKV